ncbi:hypothetical protein MSG28_003229, partial [Choristoneura fumiferana]
GEKDPAPKFFSPDIQALLKRLSRPDLAKVQQPIHDVLSQDPALIGYDTSKYIFTDISFGVDNEHRIIVERSTRHFGPLVFYLTWHQSIDSLMLDLLQFGAVREAVLLIATRQAIHRDISNGDLAQKLAKQKCLFIGILATLQYSPHGFGSLSHRLQNGTFRLDYRGQWVRGKPEGVGWWYYENGDVYFGYWKRGHRHENGNRYEGHWENDIKSGLGRFYHLHTGQLQEGCWEELADAKNILEESQLWLEMKIGDIDKKLQHCIDQMW